MAYPTVCDECLAGDHAHCGMSKLKPELARIQEWNKEHEEDWLVGGGFCVCRHGKEEGAWEREVRQAVEAEKRKN